jgi:hypothetical protein
MRNLILSALLVACPGLLNASGRACVQFSTNLSNKTCAAAQAWLQTHHTPDNKDLGVIWECSSGEYIRLFTQLVQSCDIPSQFPTPDIIATADDPKCVVGWYCSGHGN